MLQDEKTAARAIAGNPASPQAATDYDELKLRAIKSQREALERLRQSGEISDEAYHRMEEESVRAAEAAWGEMCGFLAE